jgi:organic radical activating enzyme
MSDRIKTFIKIIEERTGSPTFCVLPWLHVATRPNGDARLCCGANASGASTGDYMIGLVKNNTGLPANFGKDSIKDAFNNQYMRDVRLSMLNGRIPASCTKCFEEENNGVVSKRLWELYNWDKENINFDDLIKQTKKDGFITPIIRYFDLRLGNTCNLKCVMCSPHDSSRWMQDYEKLISNTKSDVIIKNIIFNPEKFNNNWYDNEEFWNEIFEQIPNIKQLYFAGGEPLMIKEHYKFLDEIIKRGYNKQISLRYNSNGTYVDEDIIKVWSQFKEVKYAFSIDGIFERNEYIRYPTDWNDIERSLELLDCTPDNIHVSIACAVQILNIKHIIDFAKWKLSKNYKKINKYKIDEYEAGGGLINLHLVYIPTFLSARILPKEDKAEVKQMILDFKDWLWKNYTQDDNFWQVNPYGWKRWQAILSFLEAEDHSKLLPDFTEYIRNLDSIRETNFSQTFPELAHLLL